MTFITISGVGTIFKLGGRGAGLERAPYQVPRKLKTARIWPTIFWWGPNSLTKGKNEKKSYVHGGPCQVRSLTISR